MFLEGPLWDRSCDNAFSDAVPIFAAGVEFLTGLVPIHIDGPQRDDRKDIFGQLRAVRVESINHPARLFPIRVVAA